MVFSSLSIWFIRAGIDRLFEICILCRLTFFAVPLGQKKRDKDDCKSDQHAGRDAFVIDDHGEQDAENGFEAQKHASDCGLCVFKAVALKKEAKRRCEKAHVYNAACGFQREFRRERISGKDEYPCQNRYDPKLYRRKQKHVSVFADNGGNHNVDRIGVSSDFELFTRVFVLVW